VECVDECGGSGCKVSMVGWKSQCNYITASTLQHKSLPKWIGQQMTLLLDSLTFLLLSTFLLLYTFLHHHPALCMAETATPC